MPQIAWAQVLEAFATTAGTAAVGAGVSSALAPHPHLSIPPPPGAALIDPQGAQAAAMQRNRAAAAGGLANTVTGAPAGPTGPTSGTKQLFGQ
jgi:hypothetical protein